jgi:hypothetical protein
VENQKRESSGIKTHEEIIALFKELETVEEKIKNPDLIVEEIFEPEESIQEVELPSEIPSEDKTPPSEPVGETPSSKKQKRTFSIQHEKKKIKRSHLWRKAPTEEKDLSVSPEFEQQPRILKPLRSTFVIQFDSEGNLIGLPVKKPKPKKEKKGLFPFGRKGTSKAAEQPEEEPAAGFKGKIKKLTSRFRRKKSSEAESSGGIGGKLKGLLRRKGKE